MADKGPTVSARQLAMSRALGAAFLSHQVEQLEKSVNARGGPGSANWRDRPHTARSATAYQRSQHPRSTSATPSTTAKKARDPRRSSDEERERGADIIVIDASVLVHALYQVKRWCKDGREEILIVPLEGELCIHECSPCLASTALNTLDLLKKGTSSLAQRARAASRILEAQVGTNPRIRVQRDEAFVYWDKITFNTAEDTATPGPALQSPVPSPEWVRRTVCCAKWEVDNPLVELGNSEPGSKPPKATPRVVLAVLSSQSSSQQSGPDVDQQQATASPVVPVVPLPTAYQHSTPSTNNKFEPRSSGTLVSYWASKASIEILEVDAAAPGHGRGAGAGGDWKEGEDDEAVGPRGTGTNIAGGRKSHFGHGHGHHGHPGGRRKQSVGSTGGGGDNAIPGTANLSVGASPGLVERPPAVMAMMEMVSQPSKVVRVLARGEKLDP
ncbi:hypothetical protein AX14_004675 [Amanita brunnescens Koide BX004]|nr:hypothetical protein AX14_004675 [Amanita brunnescens Koide BX004]